MATLEAVECMYVLAAAETQFTRQPPLHFRIQQRGQVATASLIFQFYSWATAMPMATIIQPLNPQGTQKQKQDQDRSIDI